MDIGLILSCFARALAARRERRFRKALWLGAVLALALLFAVYAVVLALFESWAPEVVEIPFAGPVSGLGALFSLVSILFMLGLSVFLMMPVAALFAGLMIEDVAEATEAAAGLAPPAPPRPPLYQSVVDSVNFVAVLMLVNLLAVLLYAAIGWFAPLAFWALNGYLLGREYFTLIARRRLGREAAKALRRRHRGTVWLAGMAMAGPLSVPLVNLVIPALGAATFTHLFHRLQDRPPGA